MHTDFKDIKRELVSEYKNTGHIWPWIVGFSAGKDSTLLLQLVFEAILSISPSERCRQVYVLTNDTEVESPIFQSHVDDTLNKIEQAIPALRLDSCVQVVKTRPALEHNFWFMVIGRGYRAPTRHFRWCTDRLKIRPTQAFIQSKIHESHVVLLLGARVDESVKRAESINRNNSMDRLSPHASIAGCQVYLPIRDVETEDVWSYLLQNYAPWGGRHRGLVTLYRNADGGECPIVTDKSAEPSCGSGSARFGCYVCTVVEKDRSMQGLVDAGFEYLEPLLELRDWLMTLSEDYKNTRLERRRDGTAGVGPFNFDVRKQILERVLAVQSETGMLLINPSVVQAIQQQWSTERAEAVLAQAKLVIGSVNYIQGKGPPVIWDSSRTTDQEALSWTREQRKIWFREHNRRLALPSELLAQLDSKPCGGRLRADGQHDARKRRGGGIRCAACGAEVLCV